MDEKGLNNSTKEIRILSEQAPSKTLIPKYEEALEYLGEIPDISENTTFLDQEALKAIIEEKNLMKARNYEDKIEMRRKRALRDKIIENLEAALRQQ